MACEGKVGEGGGKSGITVCVYAEERLDKHTEGKYGPRWRTVLEILKSSMLHIKMTSQGLEGRYLAIRREHKV